MGRSVYFSGNLEIPVFEGLEIRGDKSQLEMTWRREETGFRREEKLD